MDLLYVVSPKNMSRKELITTLQKRPEIKFVSLAGVDLAGNITDEKIPVELFFENIDAAGLQAAIAGLNEMKKEFNR